MASRPRILCASGEVQSCDYTATALPANTAAGQRIVEFQGELGLVVPIGDYGGVLWSRSGATSTQVSAWFPLVPGVPIALGKGAEIYLKQRTVGIVGIVTLVFVPCTFEDLQDEDLIESIAKIYAGRTGSFGPLSDSAIGRTNLQPGVDTTSLGPKQTYTVPAGVTAKVIGATAFQKTAGTPTVKFAHNTSGLFGAALGGINLSQNALQGSAHVGVAGDTFTWEVMVVGAAGSTTDFSIDVEETPA